MQFRCTAYAQEVIFGAGALDKLPEAVAVYGWTRLLLCASPSGRKNGSEIYFAVCSRGRRRRSLRNRRR